jgi:hypothetical protein
MIPAELRSTTASPTSGIRIAGDPALDGAGQFLHVT